MLFVPFSLLAMAIRPANFESTPFEWQPFTLTSLSQKLEDDRNVLVLVKSIYGGFSPELHEALSTHRDLKRLVDTNSLIPMEMEFAYVTPAPADLEREYKWVYQQGTYIKSTFYVLHRPDGSSKIYPWHARPHDVLRDITGRDWFAIYIGLSIASALMLLGRIVFQWRTARAVAA